MISPRKSRPLDFLALFLRDYAFFILTTVMQRQVCKSFYRDMGGMALFSEEAFLASQQS